MSAYEIRSLDASTCDAFARLVEKHNGCGFGGCWCTWFHSREGRPEPRARKAVLGRSVSFVRATLMRLWSSTAKPPSPECSGARPESRIGTKQHHAQPLNHRKEYEATRTDEPPD